MIPIADFEGARGSNAGDQFHELWALEQVVSLLKPHTELRAVSVEGVRTETTQPDDPAWDGVDYALYFGDTSLEHANRVEFVQLKYSSANPSSQWTIARLTASSAKKANNSVIRRMADDFRNAKSRIKPGAEMTIRLVSNQPVSSEAQAAFAARWLGDLHAASLSPDVVQSLRKLQSAGGLIDAELPEFIACVDISETGGTSRFSTRERVLNIVAGLLGDDVFSEVRELQTNVRNLMLPERHREIITEKTVLLWFGLSGRDGLFPALPEFKPVDSPIERAPSSEIADSLIRGERLVLLHGEGGCGKTTLLRQIPSRLPFGSVSVLFDCYGGGRYIHSEDRRHLPENAFLQLANDLALELNLPLFIPRSFKSPANVKTFLTKLRAAGEALREIQPTGLLLVGIDAADNSVSAAAGADPPDPCFVFQLFAANLASLPANIRFVVSARTGRRESLRLPSGTKEVICPSFTKPETKLHLNRTFEGVDDDLVEEFHTLSNKNPRVQAYAIAACKGDKAHLLDTLLPGGKSLADVLQATFDYALRKLGQGAIFDRLIAALAYLPAPAAVEAVAGVAGVTQSIVSDFALDMIPGLRLQGDYVSIGDEDFEAFIEERARPNHAATLEQIANYFKTTFLSLAYSSTYVADAVISAGRPQEVLSIIEADSSIGAIGDPIQRRQVQVRRLKLSLATCQSAGSLVDALKTILISAEAERDDTVLNEVLETELDLSVEFGSSSLRRKILLDPERVHEHGSFLAQDAARAIRAKDRATAREQLHFQEAWFRRRQDIADDTRNEWKIEDRDIAARAEAVLGLRDARTAYEDLMRWRPRNIPIRVATLLVPQLIATERSAVLDKILADGLPKKPWDLLLLIPLAKSRKAIAASALEKSLRRLTFKTIPSANRFGTHDGDENWRIALMETFVEACELGFHLQIDLFVLETALDRLLYSFGGEKSARLYLSDARRFDAMVRCWLLRAAVAGKEPTAKDFLSYVESLDPPPPEKPDKNRPPQGKGSKVKKPQKSQVSRDREDERRDRVIHILFPIYTSRLAILRTRPGESVSPELLNKVGGLGSDSYQLDLDYEGSSLRAVAARSVMALLFVQSLRAQDLCERASALLQGRFGDPLSSRRLALWSAFRLRVGEAATLVSIVGTAAADIRAQKASSSDKLQALIRLSRLLLPVSRADSEILFNEAIEIAKEIDREAFDQIAFVDAVAKHATGLGRTEARGIAADMFAFVTGTAERLAGDDHFPWTESVSALTHLDGPTAASAISRWADEGTIDLNTTLSDFALAALRLNLIGPELAHSLTLLVREIDDELRNELIIKAQTEDASRAKPLLAEMARDVLLLTPQRTKKNLGRKMLACLGSFDPPDEPWLAQLNETVAFLESAHDQPQDDEPKLPRSSGDGDKEHYVFNPAGAYDTPEKIAGGLTAAKESGLPFSEQDLVRAMRNASAAPRDRISFLNALSSLPDGILWIGFQTNFLVETVQEWKGAPAVDDWVRRTLPQIVIRDFPAMTRWIKQHEAPLLKLLGLIQASAQENAQMLLAGVAGAGGALDSRSLFGVAELIADALRADEAGTLLKWYVERLRARLPAEDQSLLHVEDLPVDMIEAAGRFLYALMSDVDTRIRWRAVHVLRRLARLNSLPVVLETVRQRDRQRDDAFRDPTAPYYFLAARLWLAVALYRISAESPAALLLCKEALLDLALGEAVPHVVVREYAKRAMLELAASQEGLIAAAEIKKIEAVNTPVKGSIAKPKASFLSFDRTGKRETRFHFDELDTIRYWYSDLRRIFPTVSSDQILAMADRWILDVWGADPEANWWNKEPRKGRYDERRFGLWSHRHGGMPTIERNGTYLEWNAMHCVVGELLQTHPIVEPEYEDGYGSFAYWLSRFLPTQPPYWLSDIRVPTPIEPRLWRQDSKSDTAWFKSANREDFVREILGERSDEWMTVDAYCELRFPTRNETVQVRSALVSPDTARSLVRALQTADNPWDFAIPTEGSDHEIDAPPFKCEGWIGHPEGDTRFDDKDPFRYDVSRICYVPGHKVVHHLLLAQPPRSPTSWISDGSSEPALLYEAWSDEAAPDEETYERHTRSDGHRLRIRKSLLRSFLEKNRMDLIFEVSIDRRLRKEYSRSYDPDGKKKEHEKILLATAEGWLEDAKGRVGAWQSPRHRTGSRQEHGHARPMDGASHRRANEGSRGSKGPRKKAGA